MKLTKFPTFDEFINEGKITVDVDYTCDNEKDCKDIAKKYKVKIKSTGKTTANVSGEKKNVIAWMKYNDYDLDAYELSEGRKTTIKRKYKDHAAKTVQSKTPVRNKVLSFISEKEKVSRADLVEFLKGMNEESGRKTSFAWVRKNSKLIKRVVEKDGSINYTLTKFGKKVLNKTSVNEDGATLQNVPGQGNVVAPTKDEIGSGDKLDNEKECDCPEGECTCKDKE